MTRPRRHLDSGYYWKARPGRSPQGDRETRRVLQLGHAEPRALIPKRVSESPQAENTFLMVVGRFQRDSLLDTLSKADRSRRMSLVKSKNTKPEMVVRRLVHGMGYRYRLHDKRLPGNPDLVFKSRKKVIFVHGCFWHRHDDARCRKGRLPTSRREFWEAKLNGNRERDRRVQRTLKIQGWSALTIWECQCQRPNTGAIIRTFLET